MEPITLALTIGGGIYFAFILIHVTIDLAHGSKIFEIYQRIGWAQEDLRKIDNKTEES